MKIIMNKYIRGISPNPKGKRNLTSKDKKKIRKGRKGDVDHIKPVALYKKAPILDLMNHFRIDVNTASGRPPKHAYDRKNNLQFKYSGAHKKKTKLDMKKIRAKRRKDVNDFLGLDKIGFGI